MADQSVARNSDFLGSLGVVAAISYTDSAYLKIRNVVSDLNYIGIHNVRTQTPNSGGDPVGQRDLAFAADAGVKFDFLVSGNRAIGLTLQDLDAFSQAHPGSIVAVEGPNEIDHAPISYAGLSGGAAAISFQNDFDAAVVADPLLSATTVYSFSLGSGATPTGGYNFAALHPYAPGGSEPFASVQASIKLAPSGAATVITETGYSSLASSAQGVDQLTQAKLTLNDIFDAKAAGVQSVYLYELLDGYSDPAGNSYGLHYGLFDNGNNPKLVATALHNLTTILSDTGDTAGTFATTHLDFSLTGAPSSAQTYEMEKSSGAHDLVLWNEPKIWDSSAHAEVAVSPSQEVVDFGQVVGEVKVYDPLLGTDPIADYSNVSSVTVAVSDHPVILEVTGLTSTTALSATSRALVGTTGADALIGSSGNDHISGGGGNDIIHAGAGNDVIDIGAGRSLVDGGDGFDTLDLSSATSAVRVQMGSSTYQTLTSKITASLVSIESVVGSAYNDTFLGSSGDDTMFGGAGNDSFTSVGGHDVIDGGAGTDTISFASSSHGVTISLASNATQTLDAGWSVQLSNIEAVVGSAFDDTLTAGDTGSNLSGGAGDDLLVSGAGNDVLSGGAGENTVSYALATTGVSVNLTNTNAQNTGGAGVDKILGVQDLIGSAYDDVLTGDRSANKLFGGAGNDILKGGAGADTLTGGSGADRFVYTLASDSAPGAYDTITDFSHADGDKIDLSGLEANSGLKGAHKISFVDHFSKSAGQMIVSAEDGGYFAALDINGDGVADFGIHIHTAAPVSSADFVF